MRASTPDRRAPRLAIPVRIRPATASDRALIMDSWIKSWLNGRGRGERLPLAHDWVPAIEAAYRDADLALVAETPVVDEVGDDAGLELVGYLVRAAPDRLAYCYTMYLFRRRRVASRLMAHAGFDVRARPWVYLWGTRKMRKMCSLDATRPARIPWRGDLANGHQGSQAQPEADGARRSR